MTAPEVMAPLEGLRVVVTRAAHQVSELSEALKAVGATVIEFPTIAIVDASDGGVALRRAMNCLHEFDWLVVTSVNSAHRLEAEFGGVQCAAVGPATQAALEALGAQVSLIPSNHVAEALVDEFPSGSGRVLVPQAADAGDVVAEGLRAKGWQVEVVEAYRTVDATPNQDAHVELNGGDVVIFTSGSTVAGFLRIAGMDRIAPVVACIGPVTAEVAERNGIKVHVIARDHTVAGLVDALVANRWKCLAADLQRPGEEP